MAQYEVTPVVHGEVIEEMDSDDIRRLMKELTDLIQNQKALVTVDAQHGLQYVWYVLAGKQKKVQGKIQLAQNEVNTVVSQILECFANKQLDMESRTLYLEIKVALHEEYLRQLHPTLKNQGISIPDPSVLDVPSALPGFLPDMNMGNPPASLPDRQAPVSLPRPERLPEAKLARIKSNLKSHCTYKGWIFYIDLDNVYTITVTNKSGKKPKEVRVSKAYAVRENGEDNTLISGDMEVLADKRISIESYHEKLGEKYEPGRDYKLSVYSRHSEYKVTFCYARLDFYTLLVSYWDIHTIEMRDFLKSHNDWDEARDGWDYEKEKALKGVEPEKDKMTDLERFLAMENIEHEF